MIRNQKVKNRHSKPIEILLIEDNLGDNRLTTEVFKEASVSNHIQIVTNGVDASKYLNQESKFQNSVLPDLILLDLNIPKKDGREILMELKKNPKLKCIPVIVLTTSQSKRDIQSKYVIIPDAGHGSNQDNPEFFNKVLIEFLRNL